MKELLSKEVRDFIQNNLNQDPASLILSHKNIAGVDIKLIAEQIRARQKATKKLPDFALNFNLIFPSSLAVEQSSSTETAAYKATLSRGELAVDLTGGLGIDTLAFSTTFKQVIYVEADPEKTSVARHNFSKLGKENIKVVNSTAEDFIKNFNQKASLIFIDPDRRPEKKKVLSLKDSLPNVLHLKTVLLSKADALLIKASPMLDISATVHDLPEVVEVHTLAINNDCKELLFLLKGDGSGLKRVAANFQHGQWQVSAPDKNKSAELGDPQTYLYEPNAAIMKSQLQDQVSAVYGLKKLHPSTHLFTSDANYNDYPGRIFIIENIIPVNRKSLRQVIPEMKANLSTRNFPEHVNKLKSKLSVKDGGDFYLFACRLRDKSYKLLITKKAK